MKPKFGEVDEAKIIKAGCGIRYDPEQLGDQSGFDFSAASHLKPSSAEVLEPESVCDASAIEEPKDAKVRTPFKE